MLNGGQHAREDTQRRSSAEGPAVENSSSSHTSAPTMNKARRLAFNVKLVSWASAASMHFDPRMTFNEERHTSSTPVLSSASFVVQVNVSGINLAHKVHILRLFFNPHFYFNDKHLTSPQLTWLVIIAPPSGHKKYFFCAWPFNLRIHLLSETFESGQWVFCFFCKST